MKNQIEKNLMMDHSTIDTRKSITRLRATFELISQRFGEIIHYVPQIHQSFLPGLDGLPVVNSFPGVFWRGESALASEKFQNPIHELAHTLYKSYISYALSGERNEKLEREDVILAILLNYSLWTGRSNWIYTLAGLFDQLERESYISIIAAALAACEGYSIGADYYYLKSQDRHPLPDAVYGIFKNKPWKITSVVEEMNLNLGWMGAVYRGDYFSQKNIIGTWMEEGASSTESAINLWAVMESRGMIFKLIRNAQKGKLKISRESVNRRISYLYVSSGKIPGFIHMIRSGDFDVDRTHWASAMFLIHTGIPASQQVLYREKVQSILQSINPESIPDKEEREDFLRRLSSGDRGNEVAADLAGALEGVGFLRDAPRTGLFEEFFRIFGKHLENPCIMATLRILSGRESFGDIKKIGINTLVKLKARSGYIAPLRVYLGVYFSEFPSMGDAMLFLRKAEVWHPAVRHSLAMLHMMDGNYDEAIRQYRLIIKKNPGSSIFWHNMGSILETAGRIREAREAYQKEREYK